jgi:SnoaL-like protein
LTIEERLAAVETRLRAAEDQLEIMRLINSYGPLADSCESQAAAELWTEDGVYDVGGSHISTSHRNIGHANIRAIYDSQAQRDLIRIGSSHFTGPLTITLHGDTAEAVAYSFVVKKDGAGWIFWRSAINHWELVRTPDGWRIKIRTNRVVDGSDESHNVMRRVMR